MSNILAKVVNPPNVVQQGSDSHPKEVAVASDIRGFLQISPETSGFDLNEQVLKVGQYIWDTDLLAWVKDTGGGTTTGGTTAAIRSKRFDIGESYIYLGEADPGIGENTPAWRIKRITLVNGNPTEAKYANAGALTATWATRASEVYT